jgi:peptidoglycan/LPS O-acetylase OafA/YrhL
MQPERQYALDNLRVLVIFLVVVLHAAISYMAFAPAWWYVLDPGRSLFFTGVVLVVDVPIMLIMFFLAGYFTFGSLAKRGAGRFLRDKLVRIGLPWVLGTLLLAPPTAYMIYYSRRVPMGLGTFWATDFWGKAYQQSVYWYLGVLLALFALAALAYLLAPAFRNWQARTQRPGWALLAGFVLVMTAASLALVRAGHSLDQWSHCYLFVYQPARTPLYLGYFALGVYASQRGWFLDGGFAPRLGPWLACCVLSGAAYLGSRLFLPPGSDGTLAGQVLVTFLFNLFCFASLPAGVAAARAVLDRDTPLWRSQARNSYGVYYLHPLILYPLALALVPLQLSIYGKFLAITLLAYLLSWAVSAALLTRAPGLRRMF